jgi:hypothetical protein
MADIKRRSLFGLFALLAFPAMKPSPADPKVEALVRPPMAYEPLLNEPTRILPGHITYYKKYRGSPIQTLQDFAEIDQAIADEEKNG